MKGILFLIFLLPGIAVAGESAPAPATRAFLEIRPPAAPPFVMQEFRVRLVVGIERDHLEKDLIPLFNRPMNLGVKVTAPWIDDLPSGVERAAEPPDRDGTTGRTTFALNDRVVGAIRLPDRTVEGRTFAVLAVDSTWMATRPGPIRLSGPTLRYAYATKFENDFFTGRRPLDRHEARVRGEAATLDVRPLPEKGRPAGFTNAIGRFTVRAKADRTQVTVGQSLKVTLTIAGTGNLALLDPPRLNDLPGFHVYGTIDDRTAIPRKVVYDLAPLDAMVTEIPSLRFPYFDPGPPPIYRTAETSPIPLAVRRVPGGAGTSAKVGSPRPGTGQAPRSRGLLFLVASILAVSLLGALLLLRRRRRSREDPAREREIRAAEEFERGTAGPDPDVASAFAEYVAARLGTPVAAVIGPDLERRLVVAGTPPELAKRAARTLEALVALRYGAPSDEDPAADARAVVREWSLLPGRERPGPAADRHP